MPEKIKVYHLNNVDAETSFGMGVKLCSAPGHFGGSVSVEHVTLGPNMEYTPHYHERSDAIVLVLHGSGYIQDGHGDRYRATEGSLAYFPHGARHGFITESEGLTFVAVQSPPIKDVVTGKEDFVE